MIDTLEITLGKDPFERHALWLARSHIGPLEVKFLLEYETHKESPYSNLDLQPPR